MCFILYFFRLIYGNIPFRDEYFWNYSFVSLYVIFLNNSMLIGRVLQVKNLNLQKKTVVRLILRNITFFLKSIIFSDNF